MHRKNNLFEQRKKTAEKKINLASEKEVYMVHYKDENCGGSCIFNVLYF